MTRAATALLGLALVAAGLACPAGPPKPAVLDTRNEACASCRMAVSDPRFAAQLVAPGELPLFFDDLGCLRDFLEAGKAPSAAVAFVADHRTKAWRLATDAAFARVPGLATPMGSQLVAHADVASRQADVLARSGAPVDPAEILGARAKGPRAAP